MRNGSAMRGAAGFGVGVLTAAAVLCSAAPAVAAPASGSGSGSGSGSSTFSIVVGRPAVSNVSSGTFRSSGLGPGTYELSVGTVGNTTLAGLTLTTRAGSIDLEAGPMIGTAPLGTVFTVSSGTGRFRHSTGTLTITEYDRTNEICDPEIPVVCSWDETLTFDGSLRQR